MDIESENLVFSSQEIKNTNLTQDLLGLNVDENSEISLYKNSENNLLGPNTQSSLNSQESMIDSEPVTKKAKIENNYDKENGHSNNNVTSESLNSINDNDLCKTKICQETIKEESTESSVQSPSNEVNNLNESNNSSQNKTEEPIKENEEETNSQEDRIPQSEEHAELNPSLDDKTKNQLDSEELMCIDEEFNYNFDKKILDNNKLMEISRISWKSDAKTQRYTRGILWSPDGTCMLTAINTEGMQIFELPNDVYSIENIKSERTVNTLKPAVHVKEGGTVYDYAWYPYMNSSVPESCCWIASRQHEPIMMWDAFTGELRCTYRGYDPFDEVESAISVQFSVDGLSVFGGYKKSIKIFQTNIPGRDYTEIKTKNAISCIAVSHSHPDTLICGTWKSNIYVYDIRSPNLGSLASLKAHQGGVTYLKYSKDGEKIFSGARKDGKIFEWDMRNYSAPIKHFDRNVSTNQRIYFDLSPSGDLIGSGNTNGLINIWDIKDKSTQKVFSLHQDCVNGFNFHPTLPIIGTSCGQFHFVDTETNDTEIEKNVEKFIEYENSLCVYWYGDIKYEELE